MELGRWPERCPAAEPAGRPHMPRALPLAGGPGGATARPACGVGACGSAGPAAELKRCGRRWGCSANLVILRTRAFLVKSEIRRFPSRSAVKCRLVGTESRSNRFVLSMINSPGFSLVTDVPSRCQVSAGSFLFSWTLKPQSGSFFCFHSKCINILNKYLLDKIPNARIKIIKNSSCPSLERMIIML